MTRLLPHPPSATLRLAALLVTTSLTAGCATTASTGSAQSAPAAPPVAASGQAAATTAAAAPAVTPPANPADVESIDAILRALYDVISGPAGQRRDWNRMRSLFVPGARLIPTGRRQDGTRSIQVWTVDQYISTVGPRLEEGGFFERELARRTERFGNVVHVFSTYDSKRLASDPQPFARGINSIQLWNDGRRWWVVTVFWEGERPDNPIPARYMQSEPTPPA
jgi:hypothetical protein